MKNSTKAVIATTLIGRVAHLSVLVSSPIIQLGGAPSLRFLQWRVVMLPI